MSRAEEQALKAYPKRGWKCKDADGNDAFLDGNRECRLAYIKGYEQAIEEIYKELFRMSLSSNAMDYVKGVGELMNELKRSEI